MRLEQLERLVQQRVSEEEASRISEHMQSCACCRQHAQELQLLESGQGDAAQTKIGLSDLGTERAASDQQGASRTKPWSMPTDRNHGRFHLSQSLATSGVVEVVLSTKTNAQSLIGQQLGQYQLLAKLGDGGFGSVYRARNLRIGREVAVKVLKRPLRDGQMANDGSALLEEARRSCKVKHPNIVQALEVAEQDGCEFLVMDLVEGEALSSFLRRGPLLVTQVVEWIQQIALGLDTLHSKDVLHLDIKPSNVLIDGVDGQAKITDIGLDRTTTEVEGVVTTIALGGTPAYMCPEQVERKVVDRRSDIFSLGILFYELLTDTRPFLGDMKELAARICSSEPAPPQTLRRSLPRDLNTIVMKCLEKSPERRYQTAAELYDDLQRWKEHRPIQALPVSLWRRAALWSRRNAWLVAVCLFLSATTLFFMERTYTIYREREGKSVALQQNRSMLSQTLATLARYQHPSGDAVLMTRELLVPLVPFYGRVLQQSQSDPNKLAEAGEASFRIAFALHKLDDLDAAHQALLESEKYYAELSKRRVGVWEQFLLATFHMDKVYLYEALQQPLSADQAVKSLQASIDMAASLIRLDGSLLHKELLASAQANLASQLDRAGRTIESIAARRQAIEVLDSIGEPNENHRRLALEVRMGLAGALDKLARSEESAIERSQSKSLWATTPLANEFCENYIQTLSEDAHTKWNAGLYVEAATRLRESLSVAESALDALLIDSAPTPSETETGVDEAMVERWLDKLIVLCGELVLLDQARPLDELAVAHIQRITGRVIEHIRPRLNASNLRAFEQLRLMMEAHGIRYRIGKPRELRVSQELESLIAGAPLLYGAPINQLSLAWEYAFEGRHQLAVDLMENSAALAESTTDGVLLYNEACVYSRCAAAAEHDTGLDDSARAKLLSEYAQRALERLARPQTIVTLRSDREAFKQDLEERDLKWLVKDYASQLDNIVQQVNNE